MGSPSGAIPRSGCLRGEEDENTDPNMKGEIKSAIHVIPKLGFIFFFGVLPNAPTFSFLYSLWFVLAPNERARELKTSLPNGECGVINRVVKIRKPQWIKALGIFECQTTLFYSTHSLYLGSVSIFAPFAFIFAPLP